jgi:hypothetical protein
MYAAVAGAGHQRDVPQIQSRELLDNRIAIPLNLICLRAFWAIWTV